MDDEKLLSTIRAKIEKIEQEKQTFLQQANTQLAGYEYTLATLRELIGEKAPEKAAEVDPAAPPAPRPPSRSRK